MIIETSRRKVNRGIKYYGTATALYAARRDMTSATLGDYAIFAGGVNISNNYVKTVESYNSLLVKSSVTDLAEGGSKYYSAIVSDYALFSGNNPYETAIDVYNSSLLINKGKLKMYNKILLLCIRKGDE